MTRISVNNGTHGRLQLHLNPLEQVWPYSSDTSKPISLPVIEPALVFDDLTKVANSSRFITAIMVIYQYS